MSFKHAEKFIAHKDMKCSEDPHGYISKNINQKDANSTWGPSIQSETPWKIFTLKSQMLLNILKSVFLAFIEQYVNRKKFP